MEIRLPFEKEAQLAQLAAPRGLRTNQLAQQGLSHYREHDTRFIEAVNLGWAAADRGDFVEHGEVGRKLKQILRS